MDGVPFLCTKSPSETGLGPGTLCCNACTWTHLSWSNKTQRNYMGLKITVCMSSCGKFWTKDTNRPKSQLPKAQSKSRESGVKSGSWGCPLHTIPQGAGKQLGQPSSPPPGKTHTFTPYKEQVRPPLRE